jgi:hypothetical protein
LSAAAWTRRYGVSSDWVGRRLPPNFNQPLLNANS